MTVVRKVGASLAGALLAVVAAAPAASAANGTPGVGECFRVSDQQTFNDYWPDVAPVPCTGRHSLEIVIASPLPADVNAVTFAQEQCDYLNVWKAAGVNQAKKGIVNRPMRLEAFYFVVQPTGAPASYVCGIGPILQKGKKDAVLISTTNPVAGLTASQKAALQFCSSVVPGAPLSVPAVTVPCSRTPRWQVTRWIMWDDLYRSYPGEAVLRARAAALCGPGTVVSVPSPKAWPGGTHRSWCYKKHT